MVRKDPVLNHTEKLEEQIVMDSDVWDGEGEPRIGVMAIETQNGVHQFFVTEALANQLVQQLRDFIAENADRLP